MANDGILIGVERPAAARLEGMVADEKLLNPLKRKFLRKKISRSETVFGIAYTVFLALLAVLIFAQRGNYDPSDRDIDIELLQGEELTLYHSPLKRWSEDGGAAVGAQVVELGILPASILDGGWALDGRLENYDPSNLYEKIDGAAELYLAFGFEQLDYLTITKEEHSITLELYDQGRFRNSLGLFAGQRRPEQVVRASGPISYYETPAGFIGRIGEYYFKIVGNSEAEAVLTKAKEILASFATLPADSLTAPAPYALLTQELGADPAQLEYRRSNVFQYDFASEFWFAPVKGEGKARYFIHESGDVAAAAELYRRLLEEQKWEHAVVKEDGERVILKHEFLGTFFALSRVNNLLMGIEVAATSDAARRHLDRLEGVVNDGG
jgi:hypothetical protein